jgi:predicted metal-dependent hydrolase
MGNISFSYRLMLYPEPAREYVIVHELAHLLEMNHSKRFYKIIESVLPDYKWRKSLLK